MCGIAGVIHTNGMPVSPLEIKAMTKVMEHRGPDDSGILIDKNVAFGHQRLAIIDVSSLARQPMASADALVVLAYNGMIFNFLELRAELQSLGFAVNSSGDTAVLLAAWQAWGKDCVRRLNGHFSFAVLDKRANAVFLVRDRYGTRPLYWSKCGNTFIFASEIKALLAHPKCSPKLDLEVLPEYFTFQNIFTNRTFFKGINLFPRASIGTHSLQSSSFTVEQYWNYDFREDEKLSDYNACVEELDYLLRQAVHRHLLSDVEVGAYLSGGIDSGLLSAYASQSGSLTKNFTCGFELNTASGIELAFDERGKAEAMSALFKTEHYEMVLKSGDMERIMPSIMSHLEMPRMGQSYPNYYIAQLASKFVKVILSGIGGDELFAGYPWRYYYATHNKDFGHFINNYYDFWQRLLPKSEYDNFFTPMGNVAKSIDTREIFCKVFDGYNQEITCPADSINLSLYFESATFMHGLLLVDDALSMAHGLESRSPFLDNDVVDFAMRCPVRHKLQSLKTRYSVDENDVGLKKEKYWLRHKDGKQILRKVAAKYIHESIAQGHKQGFSAPDASWFKGESIDFIKKRLLQKNSAIYEVIDYNTVNRLVTEHLQGKVNRRLLIWSLLCFDNWLATFTTDN